MAHFHSNVFQLPMDLRLQWWDAIMLEEREAIVAEFKARPPHEVHQERMKQVMRDIGSHGIEDIVTEFVHSDYCSRKESDFVHFLTDGFTQAERSDMLVRLKRCHCCSRHTHYKNVPFKPADAVPESKKVECFCNCRHYTRLFARKTLA